MIVTITELVLIASIAALYAGHMLSHRRSPRTGYQFEVVMAIFAIIAFAYIINARVG